VSSHPTALAVLALFLVGPAVAADKADFTEIDKHALAATGDDEKTLEALAKYLAGPCKTDADKARAAYRWVTDRIAYDVDAYLARRAGDTSAEATLKRRMAVCEGYANLYLDLCKRMGLQVVKVRGYVNADGDAANRVLADRSLHTWNAVTLDGTWKLVDPTFGAGGVEGKEFRKHFYPYYFCTPPDRMLFTHLPKEPRWQLVEKPISDVEFLRRPAVPDSVLQLNVSTKDLLAVVADKAFTGFPVAYTRSDFNSTDVRIPLNKTLKAGEEYVFEFTPAAALNDLIIVNGGLAIPFEKNGDKLTLKVTAKKGQLVVATNEKDGRYNGVVLYMVE
jgi:hypothetical protein